jgi:hypothetical protein
MSTNWSILHILWHYACFRVMASPSLEFPDSWALRSSQSHPHQQHPNWTARVSLLVWHLVHRLSGIWGLTSSPEYEVLPAAWLPPVKLSPTNWCICTVYKNVYCNIGHCHFHTMCYIQLPSHYPLPKRSNDRWYRTDYKALQYATFPALPRHFWFQYSYKNSVL